MAEGEVLVLSPSCFKGTSPFLLILDHTQCPDWSQQDQSQEAGPN